jgi:sugar transferase (PEP-CTERM system associated)
MVRIFNQYVSVKRLFLMALETVLIFFSLLCGAKLRFLGDPLQFSRYTAMPLFALQTGVFVLMIQICFHYCGFYDLAGTGARSHESREALQIVALLESLGAACLLLGLMYYLFPVLVIGRGVLVISTALLAGLVMLSRFALDKAWSAAAFQERVLIVGAGELGAKVAIEMARRGDLAMHLAGFVAVKPVLAGHHSGGAATALARELAGYPILGGIEDLDTIAPRNAISRIVVALEDRRGQLPISQLVKLRVQGLRIEDAHTAIASLTGRVWLDTVRPSWFVFSDGFHRSKLNLILKRSVDLAFGIVGFVLASPLMIVLAAAIRLDSKGPVIYRQARVGLAERTFEVLKFRSMRTDAEALSGVQWAIENDPRVTRVGRFMRKYRLDELPQFLNVIRGEMSFVGPRPERPVFVEQLRQVISYYDERHSVRPGLTGWAQVQYRYGAGVEDAARKLEYDLFYLKNMSLFFDLVIVLKTVRIVLTGFGAR